MQKSVICIAASEVAVLTQLLLLFYRVVLRRHCFAWKRAFVQMPAMVIQGGSRPRLFINFDNIRTNICPILFEIKNLEP